MLARAAWRPLGLSVLIQILATATVPSAVGQADRPHPPMALDRVTLVHVNVVDVVRGRLLADRTVYIEAGTIQLVRESGAAGFPQDAFVIDGGDGYLIPGLADMHVHHTASGVFAADDEPPLYGEEDLLLYLVNGVTTVRNMAGTRLDLSMKRRLARGEILGPHYYTAGPPILSGRSERAITTVEGARDAVASQRRAGYDFIKVYCCFSEENRAIYREILAAAEDHQLPVVGHVQTRLSGREAFRLRSIEHLEHLPRFFEHEPRGSPKRLVVTRELLESGAFVTPTLAPFEVYRLLDDGVRDERLKEADIRYASESQYDGVMRSLREGRSYLQDPEHARMTKELFELSTRYTRFLHEQGVPLMLGTDTGGIFPLVPGFAVHRELELLNQAGLEPLDALRTATINVARFLDNSDTRGSISEGKAADLVLLDDNPLLDISNTRTIRGVMIGKTWIDRPAIDGILQDLRKR